MSAVDWANLKAEVTILVYEAVADVADGATEDLTQFATSIADNVVAGIRLQREDLVDELPDEAFERLDDQFLAYEDDLSMLLYDYVQLHHAEIRGASPATV